MFNKELRRRLEEEINKGKETRYKLRMLKTKFGNLEFKLEVLEAQFKEGADNFNTLLEHLNLALRDTPAVPSKREVVEITFAPRCNTSGTRRVENEKPS